MEEMGGTQYAGSGKHYDYFRLLFIQFSVKNTEESVDNTASSYDGFAFSRVLIIR